MAVTVTYLYAGSGFTPGSAAPTQAQSQQCNMVIATIQSTAATDDSVSITHDFALQVADITAGFPEIGILQQTNELTQGIWEVSEGLNHSTFGLAGAIGPVKVFIKRPHSLVR